MQCSDLTSVIIGNSVTSIGNSAFHGCTCLNSISIPNSVTTIGDGAFFYCTGLTFVTISNSVTSIGNTTFSGCSRLTSITIPNSVTSIGYLAFEDCSGLKSIIIGENVESIGYRAFKNCRNIEIVTCNAENVPSMGDDVFEDSYVDYATLKVPDASIDAYTAADQWRDFGTIEGIGGTEPSTLALTDDAPTLTTGTYAVGNATYTRATTDGNYATFCLPFDISSADITDYFSEVYTTAPWCLYNTADGTLRLMLKKVAANTTISAGTPFIARTITDNTVLKNGDMVTFGETTDNPTPTQLEVFDNDGGSVLKENTSLTVKIGGTYSKLTDLDSDKYRAFTTSGSFGPCTWLNCFRAYIYKDDSSSASRIQNIVLDFGDEETGIDTIESSTMSEPKTCYNLNGQRIAPSTMKSGLYIINGKKVIKK